MKKNIKQLMLPLALIAHLFACDSDSAKPKTRKTPNTSQVRLVSIEKDGENWMSYAYDNNGVLTSCNSPGNFHSVYHYNSIGRIDSVVRFLMFQNEMYYRQKLIYTYIDDTKIQKLEYYGATRVLANTATYTYTGNQLTNIDNSNKSTPGLQYRNFEYSPEGNVSRVSSDFGNPEEYTYYTNKQVETPLAFDISNPTNMIKNLISTYSRVTYSSYTATYEFDAEGFVTIETRSYPNRPDNDPSNPKTETYTYTYENF